MSSETTKLNEWRIESSTEEMISLAKGEASNARWWAKAAHDCSSKNSRTLERIEETLGDIWHRGWLSSKAEVTSATLNVLITLAFVVWMYFNEAKLATPVPIPTVTVTAAPDIKIQVGNDQYVRSVRQ